MKKKQWTAAYCLNQWNSEPVRKSVKQYLNQSETVSIVQNNETVNRCLSQCDSVWISVKQHLNQWNSEPVCESVPESGSKQWNSEPWHGKQVVWFSIQKVWISPQEIRVENVCLSLLVRFMIIDDCWELRISILW